MLTRWLSQPIKSRRMCIWPIIKRCGQHLFENPFEFYVYSFSIYTDFYNIFHFTKENDGDVLDCIHRIAGLWVQPISDSRQLTASIQGCVNGKWKHWEQVMTRDQWHALEAGFKNDALIG